MQQAEQEKLVLSHKSDEWLKNPSQSYSPPSPAIAAGSYYAGHQQSNYSDDSPAVSSIVSSTSADSHSYYEPDRSTLPEYAGDLRPESTMAVMKPESPVRSFIRRWSRH